MMKRIILVIFILIIFSVFVIFRNKFITISRIYKIDTNLNSVEEVKNSNLINTTSSRSFDFYVNTQTATSFIYNLTTSHLNSFESLNISNINLQFLSSFNERFLEISKKINKASDSNIDQYKLNLKKINEKLRKYGDIKIDSASQAADIIFNVIDDLSNLKPPSIFYEFHLRLVRNYLMLAMALKEYSLTTDPVKKIVMYNIIKMSLDALPK